MAQPNDVKSILEIGQGPDSGLPRRKEHKLKDKKKRPGKIKDLKVYYYNHSSIKPSTLTPVISAI